MRILRGVPSLPKLEMPVYRFLERFFFDCRVSKSLPSGLLDAERF